MIVITDYFAFSDESNYTDGDYRSVSIVTVHEDIFQDLQSELENVLNKYNIKITSFKWKEIKNNNKTDALKEILLYLFDLMKEKLIIIEILTWNIHDSRHNVVGREDTENLSYMYDKLIKDFANRHLNAGDCLYLFPDQNSAINWEKLEEILFNQEIYIKTYHEEFDAILLFKKVKIKESSTENDPLIQIADIFAGIGRSSFIDYDSYERWLDPQQQRLFEKPKKFTNRQKYRFEIYKLIDEWAKDNELRISLKSTRGFISHNPDVSLNFWLYEPRHKKDKAPTRFD